MPTCTYCSESQGLTLVLIAGRSRRSYLCADHLAMHKHTCECCGGLSHNLLHTVQYMHEDETIKTIKLCYLCFDKIMPHWCPSCDSRHTAPVAGASDHTGYLSDLAQRTSMIPHHTQNFNRSWISQNSRNSHYSDEVMIDVFGGRCFDSDNPYLCWTCHAHLQEEVANSEWHSCQCCGAMTRNVHPQAGHVCLSCLPGLFICKSCGEYGNISTQQNFQGQLCHKCIPKHTCCKNCGTYRPTSDTMFKLMTIRRGHYCTVCAPKETWITCPDCGTLDYESPIRRMERLWRNHGDDLLRAGTSLDTLCQSLPDDMKGKCSHCLSEQIGYCKSGKHLVFPPNQLYRSSGGLSICATCYEMVEIPLILNYSLKPKYTLYGKHPLRYGAEIECDFSCGVPLDTAIKAFRGVSSTREIFYKHDGSLSNGFEAVTMPMDFHYMHSHTFPQALDNIAKCYGSAFYNLLGNGSKAGLHIHMTKDAFTSLHLYKFLEFFNKHSTFVEKIAGRNANSYCQKFRQRTVHMAKEKGGTDKYTVINLSHDKTIEIRIFSAATSSENFLMKLEFLDALFNATNRLSLKEPLTPPEFVNYVESKRGIYPNLHSFLKQLS